MNSPSEGSGREGRKRILDSLPHLSEIEPKATLRKTRKKKPLKQRVVRPKRRGQYKPKNKNAIDNAVPTFEVKEIECIYSDEEENKVFPHQCPPDFPAFGSPSPLTVCFPQPPPKRGDLGNSDFDQECSASVSSPGGLSGAKFSQGSELLPHAHSSVAGSSQGTEELSYSISGPSILSTQPWKLETVSPSNGSESSATEQFETGGSLTVSESCIPGVDSGNDASDSLQSPATQPVSASVDSVDILSTICAVDVPSTPVILKAVEKFREVLPPRWIPIGNKVGFHLVRLSVMTPTAIQREVFIPHGGDVEIFVHCKVLPREFDLLEPLKMSKIVLNIDSIDEFCCWGAKIARTMEQYATCCGANSLERKEAWENIPNAFIDKNPYREEKYSETCRSTSCNLLIPLSNCKRCVPCGKVLKSLKKRWCHLMSKEPARCTGNIYLTQQQLLQKLELQHKEMKRKDSRIAYLEGKVTDLLDES